MKKIVMTEGERVLANERLEMQAKDERVANKRFRGWQRRNGASQIRLTNGEFRPVAWMKESA